MRESERERERERASERERERARKREREKKRGAVSLRYFGLKPRELCRVQGFGFRMLDSG